MIKLIAIIDGLRGILDTPNEDILTHYSHVISTGRTINVLNTDLEPVSGAYDAKLDIESSADSEGTVWVLGGSELLEYAIQFADELHIIQVNGIYECKSFFPHFEDKFFMEKRKPIRDTEGLVYQFQTWKPDSTHLSDSWDFGVRDNG